MEPTGLLPTAVVRECMVRHLTDPAVPVDLGAALTALRPMGLGRG